MAETLLALKCAFRKFDKKKTGKLDVAEFKDLIDDLLKTDAKDRKEDVKSVNENLMTYVPALFDHLDADKDRSLTERELCSLGMYGTISEIHTMITNAVFYAMDKDNDGIITFSEMKEIISMLIPDKDLGIGIAILVGLFMLENADVGLTAISIDALVEHKTNSSKGEVGKDPNEKYKLLFRLLDTNTDGKISTKELQKFFNSNESGLEKKVLDAMLQASTAKEDGKLSYAEFCAILDKIK